MACERCTAAKEGYLADAAVARLQVRDRQADPVVPGVGPNQQEIRVWPGSIRLPALSVLRVRVVARPCNPRCNLLTVLARMPGGSVSPVCGYTLHDGGARTLTSKMAWPDCNLCRRRSVKEYLI